MWQAQGCYNTAWRANSGDDGWRERCEAGVWGRCLGADGGSRCLLWNDGAVVFGCGVGRGHGCKGRMGMGGSGCGGALSHGSDKRMLQAIRQPGQPGQPGALVDKHPIQQSLPIAAAHFIFQRALAGTTQLLASKGSDDGLGALQA